MAAKQDPIIAVPPHQSKSGFLHTWGCALWAIFTFVWPVNSCGTFRCNFASLSQPTTLLGSSLSWEPLSCPEYRVLVDGPPPHKHLSILMWVNLLAYALLSWLIGHLTFPSPTVQWWDFASLEMAHNAFQIEDSNDSFYTNVILKSFYCVNTSLFTRTLHRLPFIYITQPLLLT